MDQIPRTRPNIVASTLPKETIKAYNKAKWLHTFWLDAATPIVAAIQDIEDDRVETAEINVIWNADFSKSLVAVDLNLWKCLFSFKLSSLFLVSPGPSDLNFDDLGYMGLSRLT